LPTQISKRAEAMKGLFSENSLFLVEQKITGYMES
jgi:hypothetical protein